MGWERCFSLTGLPTVFVSPDGRIEIVAGL